MRVVIAAVSVFLIAAPALSQPAAAPAGTNTDARALGPRMPKAAYNPFSVASWASLDEPQGSSIRAESQMDLAAREDRNYIEVFGRKKGPDVGWHPRVDGDSPAWSDAAIPGTIPIGPPTSCGGEAYRTVGGQPATGADMVGALGGGRC